MVVFRVMTLALCCLGLAGWAQGSATPVQTVEVMATFAHNTSFFTQGLFFSDGYLYESTGRYGHSGLFCIDLETGVVLREARYPHVFVEGSAVMGDQIHVLTWQDGIRIVVRKPDFIPLAAYPLSGEGWGLCTDGHDLWLSNGTNVLYRYRPLADGRWQELGRLRVVDAGRPVGLLNELESVNGYLLANVWQTNRIAVIDPSITNAATGECPVVLWLDCLDLKAAHPEADVLNGIAWDATAKRLVITGKLWPLYYQISLPTLLRAQ